MFRPKTILTVGRLFVKHRNIHLFRQGTSVLKKNVSVVAKKHYSEVPKIPFPSQLCALKECSPCFSINPENVQIIQNPDIFFSTIKREINNATSQITLASLYLGTGPQEQEILDCLIGAANRGVEIRILLDYFRGTRGKENSASFLSPLTKFSNVKVSLFHTPQLSGLLKKLMPPRVNEVVGLQHMKVYSFDSNLMLSGANLSDLYFTDRQDRYVLFHKESLLNDFFTGLVSQVMNLSYQVNPAIPIVSWPHKFPEPAEKSKLFTKIAQEKIEGFLKEQHKIHNYDKLANNYKNGIPFNTFAFPLVQMGVFKIDQDYRVLKSVLSALEDDSRVDMASGYFNFPTSYQNLVLNSKAKFSVLTASPEANSFFNSKGFSYWITFVYTSIEKRFLKSIDQHQRSSDIHLHEYNRPGWTFHGKGLWLYLNNCKYPQLTFIGSPNFGYRSVYRDLEAQVALFSTDDALQLSFSKEHDNLMKHTNKIEIETLEKEARIYPLWLPPVANLLKSYF